MRRLLLAPLLFAVACGGGSSARLDGGGPVTVELDRSGYALGDSAAVTVVNSGAALVRFAEACDVSVEGWTGGGWGTVYEPDCSHLRVRPQELAPGARVTVRLPLEPCPAGALTRYAEFRLRLRVQLPDGGDRIVPSRPFALRAR